jgi:hypothetical protein
MPQSLSSQLALLASRLHPPAGTVKTFNIERAVMEQAVVISNADEPNPVDATGLCLLSLDGGGVRGLSTLYILKGLMDRLNHERQITSLPQVKPCEIFDLIGGTSTGGFVELQLAAYGLLT